MALLACGSVGIFFRLNGLSMTRILFCAAAARARQFPHHALSLAIVTLASTLGSTSAHAQAAPRPDAALPLVTITGNPLGATDLIAPTDSY